jgi:hypothetical protein
VPHHGVVGRPGRLGRPDRLAARLWMPLCW